MRDEDVREHNRRAWNAEVEKGNPWTVPVSSSQVAAARRGEWHIVLTPLRPVPPEWFPTLEGADVLCLAAGGGQQGPLLAAAGARVVVYDNSPAQLGRDRMVAERDGLDLRTVEGDMRDLAAFPDASFDLVVHPVSNCFVPRVLPVWREAFRVLRSGGTLLAGAINPVRYLFGIDAEENGGPYLVRHAIPYSDLEGLSAVRREQLIADGEPLEYGHTLQDLIGGQLDAGFLLAGFFEDVRDPAEDELSKFVATFIATKAVKP